MTDTPQPSQEASEVWQDVKRYDPEWKGRVLYYKAADVERARAADAQQIAALRAENEQLRVRYPVEDYVALVEEVTELEAQLTALQAEQAQWQREKDRQVEAFARIRRRLLNHLGDNPHGSNGLVYESLDLIESQLAALTAQQETPK